MCSDYYVAKGAAEERARQSHYRKVQEAANLRHRVRKLEAQVERLRERLNMIRRHWQEGIGEIDSPWRKRMAELVGDAEGLEEAAKAAGGDCAN